MNVLYVMRDRGITGCCKIGKDTSWPRRYKQARCHSPRGIAIDALWELDSSAEAADAEVVAARRLQTFRRAGHVKEWFDIDAQLAVAELIQLDCFKHRRLTRNPVVTFSGPDLHYDDWRDGRDSVLHFQWYLWLFMEESPHRHLKATYGAIYDSPYKYAFTYNPFPVHLIAGFEAEGGVGRNRQIQTAWQTLVDDPRLGLGILREEVGWLREEVTPDEVAAFLAKYEMVPFDLARPKPPQARPKEASVTAVPIGAVPPLRRVRPWNFAQL